MASNIYAQQQYQQVKGSRQVLFDYCGMISPYDFIRSHPSFGNGGSIRSLLIHVANTYEAWIAQRALHQIPRFVEDDTVADMTGILPIYEQIDSYMQRFMEGMQENQALIEYEKEGIKSYVSPLQLFSHVVTHEFHHKGQLLSLSRLWGYVPVDTDIIR
jgi:uncharacterized damage-inducible protein DinB